MKTIITVNLAPLKKLTNIVLFFLVLQQVGLGQQTVDLSFQFPPGGPFRKYHIYVPSSYNSQVPARMMLGLHGESSGGWNGQIWRDSLITFAEYKDLLLVCPDGGADGRIDDSVDYAFSRALIDSVFLWYNVDPVEVFAMGFSVGGKAVYEFGLKYHKLFRGFIPIAASIADPDWQDDIIGRAKCKNYFLVHGDRDNPNTRYTPVKGKLQAKGANVDGILMAGIGHTFDFPNRNQILYMAFNYIDTAACDYTGIETFKEEVGLGPNPARAGQTVHLFSPSTENYTYEIYNYSGQLLMRGFAENKGGTRSIETGNLSPDLYIVKLLGRRESRTFKLLILE